MSEILSLSNMFQISFHQMVPVKKFKVVDQYDFSSLLDILKNRESVKLRILFDELECDSP